MSAGTDKFGEAAFQIFQRLLLKLLLMQGTAFGLSFPDSLLFLVILVFLLRLGFIDILIQNAAEKFFRNIQQFDCCFGYWN